MKTLIIFQEIIDGYSVIMYRDKYANGDKRYRVVSAFHVFGHCGCCVCNTTNYDIAFDAYRNAVVEIIDSQISTYKKNHY